jgi:hypothetical protein
MSAGIYDIQTEHGVDYTLTMDYLNSSNAVISLSGKTLTFSVKRSYISMQGDYFAISTGTVTEGILPFPDSDNSYGTITGSSGGIITLTIPAITMSSVIPGIYYYSLHSYGAIDEVILRGKFEIEAF